MRDAQRFFALPWFIYSLNITASREFPNERGEHSGETSRAFPLWEIQSWYALVHRA
jgi:hypothetical protein